MSGQDIKTEQDPKLTNVVLVDRSSLRSLNYRPTFSTYLKELWENRYFMVAYARSSAFGDGRGTFFGRLWMILNPAFQIAIYGLIFGVVLRTHRGIDNFVGFLTIGVVFFRFLIAGINGGSSLIQRNRNLIGSFQFPRATIPISSSIRAALDNLIPGLVAICAALLFQWNKGISWTIVLVPILFIMMHVWAAGAMMITARFTAFFPDGRNFLRLVTQGLFFISGVFFSLDRFSGSIALSTAMKINPLYQFLHAIRQCTLDGIVPSTLQWLYLSGWTLLVFVFGLVYFWGAEERYAHVK